MYKILVLNLGGTSTKLAVFENKRCVLEGNASIEKPADRPMTGREEVLKRKETILKWLADNRLKLDDFDALAPRMGITFYGGDGGTFQIEGALRDCLEAKYFPDRPLSHPVFGVIGLLDELCGEMSHTVPILTTDPASVNQYLPEAELTGCSLITKRSSFHALNHRAVARKAAEDIGKTYETANFIVAHLGGGVSVGAHSHGRIIDVNDATGDGDGPFSANRSGSVPAGPIIDLCFSGTYTKEEAIWLLRGNSGLKAYLGTEDLREAEERAQQGDETAALVIRALAYQISREIGACYATLCGDVDAIVLTAGMAHSDLLCNLISCRVGKIAPILRYPGGFEKEALAFGAYQVLSGEAEPSVYHADLEYKNVGGKVVL